ncbi:unnamed protein product [Blepharisma stoltei]|uniref:Uncharacterized protein n=1 Tax=Blepharisma stoltei TaxID=1481888 RepID=A0AAU9IZH1_9CILI|nr:unnamed protein product [Blepharisma stoltei]
MSGWFGKNRDQDLIEERCKLTQLYIDQQREENGGLRKQLGELKEQSLRYKIMLDELIQNASSYDKTVEDLKAKIKAAEQKIVAQGDTEKKLDEDLKRLRGIKNSILPTDFQVVATQGASLQEILDNCDQNEEAIYFKDKNGSVWEIMKRPGFDMNQLDEHDEEQPQLETFVINPLIR